MSTFQYSNKILIKFIQNSFWFYLLLGTAILLIGTYHFCPPLFNVNENEFGNESIFFQDKLAKLNRHIWFTFLQEKSPNCTRIVAADKEYISGQSSHRISYTDAANLSMDCGSIRTRNHFIGKPFSEAEAQFPVAYARIVYTDYRFLEAELATNYHPQNWYCYAVDAKSKIQFQQRMEALAACFPNVLVPKSRFSVDSAGHKMADAYVSCMHALAADKEIKWKYLFTLQNHDVQVKTNEELVQILTWLGGANDVQYEFDHSGPQQIIAELQRQHNWTFAALNLFINDSLNYRQNDKGQLLSLRLAKGYAQTSLARGFVDFLVQKMDLAKVFAHLNAWRYGADELFFQTLSSTDDLNAPGGFTRKCYEQRVFVPYITRS